MAVVQEISNAAPAKDILQGIRLNELFHGKQVNVSRLLQPEHGSATTELLKALDQRAELLQPVAQDIIKNARQFNIISAPAISVIELKTKMGNTPVELTLPLETLSEELVNTLKNENSELVTIHEDGWFIEGGKVVEPLPLTVEQFDLTINWAGDEHSHTIEKLSVDKKTGKMIWESRVSNDQDPQKQARNVRLGKIPEPTEAGGRPVGCQPITVDVEHQAGTVSEKFSYYGPTGNIRRERELFTTDDRFNRWDYQSQMMLNARGGYDGWNTSVLGGGFDAWKRVFKDKVRPMGRSIPDITGFMRTIKTYIPTETP